MQKNWYIIYTKPGYEKKVATAFTKKKIENFFPVNCNQIEMLRKKKSLQIPLFDSYVFANITEADLTKVKMIGGVVNPVYWKGKPAIVQKNEIETIKEFTTDHQNIKLVKSKINQNDVLRVIDGANYSMDGNLLTIKNITIKVSLPSLGFIMIAEVIQQNAFGSKVSFGNKEILLQT